MPSGALRRAIQTESLNGGTAMVTFKETQEYLSRALPLSDPRAWPGIIIILAGIASLICWGVWS